MKTQSMVVTQIRESWSRNRANFPLYLAAVGMTICGFTHRRELQAVSEKEIEAILSHRDLTFGGERHPYEMKIWAGPETGLHGLDQR
jgi:hypothetical protein